eukprot:CAMPEP_0179459014 /NCGR_PEP_ID=MMETSP0799-20121207/42424_1 /TAXON_ID=46947 /ORGANISM="Geminigera cryophila, Strain CCMP2564" /LENGTH=252 /DNA_ID=CAMNT_0021260561 /DNA_START=14 /DNA_END=772 /DNA_ORIENTATION=+
MGKLDGKVIIVTGASSGIGATVAKCLAAEGAWVAVLARRKDKLETLASEINAAGVGKAVAVSGDVTVMQSMTDAAAETKSQFGKSAWGLVNCAGLMHYQYVSDLDVESWTAQLDTNCKGTMHATAAVLPFLTSEENKEGGHIVNISSDAGRKPFPGLCVYSATKHFVEAWAHILREELAPKNIKVTCIQPGDCKTELLNHHRASQPLEEFAGAPDRAMLVPEDIGDAIVYAMTRKPHCAVNEIMVEPTLAPI